MGGMACFHSGKAGLPVDVTAFEMPHVRQSGGAEGSK